MKILYLNYSGDILQKMRIEDVARGLRLQGHDVTIIHMNYAVSALIEQAKRKQENAYTAASSRKAGFRIPRPKNRSLLISLGEIRRFLENLRYLFVEFRQILKHRPEMLLVRPMPVWSIFVSAFLLRQKMVMDTDGPLAEMLDHGDTSIPQFYKKLENFCAGRLKAMSVISTKMKEHYASFGGDPGRIFICPNGVNSDLFKPDLDPVPIRKDYGLTDEVVVGFMGNLAPWHGLPGLLNEFPALAAKYDNIRFLLVGFQLDWDNLPDSIDKSLLDCRDKVICTGRIPFESMPHHLKAIDIFVLPYPKTEFFYFSPVKLFESMAVGCALVAAGIGQISEVIEDGKDGLLFPAGDYPEMRRKIADLIENPQLRRALGESATKKIYANYLWEQTTEAMVKAYHYAYSGQQG